jgi:hypothetical protein
MSILRTLFRGIRPAPAMSSQAPAAGAAPADEPEDHVLYLRDPHRMLRMDAATAEAYVAAMSA